ncbi:unnamed protein product, partial [Staurois parvus]
ADPCSDNCRFSAVLSPCSDSVRKVQPRTGNCISRRSAAGIGTDHQGTDDQCPDDRCPAVPPASSAPLCPAVRPPVP